MDFPRLGRSGGLGPGRPADVDQLAAGTVHGYQARNRLMQLRQRKYLKPASRSGRNDLLRESLTSG